jgi:hypothetical protein
LFNTLRCASHRLLLLLLLLRLLLHSTGVLLNTLR